MKFRSRLSTPNLIPTATMADVSFLLIIFFLLTTTFAEDSGLDIGLPKAMTSQEMPKREVTVWVTREGRIRVDRLWVTQEGLAEVLGQRLGEAEVKAVTIRGDERVPYGTIVTIMDAAKLLGADITLLAEIAPGRRTIDKGRDGDRPCSKVEPQGSAAVVDS